MTRKQETGMAVITAVVLLLLILLSSCSTKKTIAEYVTVHDTLVVHHSDTLKIIQETMMRATAISPTRRVRASTPPRNTGSCSLWKDWKSSSVWNT